MRIKFAQIINDNGRENTSNTPYYQDDHCTIYHGHCRNILPELPKVDLVLTDPFMGSGTTLRAAKDLNRHESEIVPTESGFGLGANFFSEVIINYGENNVARNKRRLKALAKAGTYKGKFSEQHHFFGKVWGI
jgi:DNA modification methylase